MIRISETAIRLRPGEEHSCRRAISGQARPGSDVAAARAYPVRECLLIILNEEWEHRLYAERDLNALEAHAT